jgi:hydrogenase small subunit
LRRGFYDAGLYAKSFNDEGYRKGYCLYKLGCKGPTTYNACASLKWNQGTSWPVQSGHPCLGCSQPNFWDGGGFYEGQGAILQKPGLAALGGAALAGIVVGGGLSVANSREKERAKQTLEQSPSDEEKEE